MLYELGEIVAVKQDSLIVIKGEIVAVKQDTVVLHPVYDNQNYIAAKVIENNVTILNESKESVTFSDIHMASYDT